MRTRLFAFLSVLVIIMVVSAASIFMMTGPFKAGGSEAVNLVGKDLAHLSQNLTVQCGDSSVQLVLLSESLSRSIENQLQERRIRVNDLQEHPELLEEIIGNELNLLQLALEKTKCSGVFMVLNATINPALENAENSKAGLYLRNSEPNMAGPDATRLYLRGFPGIAMQNGLSLQSKWDMEFDVTGRDFYHLPLETYQENDLPLSRLYYWSFGSAIDNLDENVLLCSIPLIDSNGQAFGICGFEISTMNFQLNYRPDTSLYKQVLCLFSTLEGNRLDTYNALFSANNTALCTLLEQSPLMYAQSRGLNTYSPEQGQEFLGLHELVKLYPDDSPFAGQRFALALLVPKQELDIAASHLKIQLILICAALLLLGVLASVFMSGKFLRPIISTLDTIHADNIGEAAKTNIMEIDQLIEKIRALHTKELPLPDNLFEDFIRRVPSLTPTEMRIFRCYLEGKSNGDILDMMFISVNTLKTHNRHIYTKLGVSSKDELMLYIELIKKGGLTSEII